MTSYILKLSFTFLFFLSVFSIGSNIALAAPTTCTNCYCNNTSTGLCQIDCESPIGKSAGCVWRTGTSGGTTGAADVDLKNPLGDNNTSVPKLIGQIIKVALGIVGSLALAMFVYGGFVWMLAAGNEQAITKGKNILSWAAIGLAVIFASYSLVSFVIDSLAKK